MENSEYIILNDNASNDQVEGETDPLTLSKNLQKLILK